MREEVREEERVREEKVREEERIRKEERVREERVNEEERAKEEERVKEKRVREESEGDTHIPTHLEGAHQCLVHTHHGSSIVKLPTVVGSREEGHQLTLGKELVAILYHLMMRGSVCVCMWI